jgi:iron complex outermembrane receptor protein
MEMKKMFLGICYLLISLWLPAQVIKGVVADDKGKLVAGATVELSGNNISTTTTTDARGEFSFNRLKAGDYVLRISFVGFETLEQAVTPGSEPIRFMLKRHNLFLQPVEIKATRAGENAPFTRSDLNARELEKNNLGQDLPFMLNMTPSVVVNSDAGNGVGYTGIRIRGSDGTRINVTLNGIPYNDAESQGSFFVDLPDFTSSVNNVQIQRGVGTSSNGAGAFGATINLSTNEVNTKPYVEINNSFGSFNTWKHTVKAGSGLIEDHFTFDARLSKIGSDGYIDRARSDLKSFYLSGAYLTGNTSLRLNVFSGTERTYQAWNGVAEWDLENNRTINYAGMEKPGEPYHNQTDNFQQDHFQFFVNHRFSDRLTASTAFFYTIGKGYYEEYHAGEAYADYGLPEPVIGNDTLHETDLIRQLWLDNDFYGQIFSVQYNDDVNELTLGGGWSRYDGKHYGEIIWAEHAIPNDYRWYDLDAYKTDVNIYGKYQRRLGESWSLFGDLQYRRVLYNINGFRKNPDLQVRNTYDFFNPKVGVSWSNRNYRIYASYSQGNKEPVRDDFEASIVEQPKPEKLHDFELGIERRNKAVSWAATLYYMLYKDQLVLTGKVNEVGAYTRVNVPNSFRMGIELQGSARITNWLQAGANLTLSRNRIKDFTEYYDDYDNDGQKSIQHGTTDISFSPDLIGAATISILPVKNLEISFPGKYVGRQYLDNTSNKQRSLDPYFVQDARIMYTVKNMLVREAAVIFQVSNVFNKKYEPNGYTFSYQWGGELITENYYYPMAGTNVMVGLNVKL